MITKFKIFENVQKDYEIGDWAIVKYDTVRDGQAVTLKFLGQIKEKDYTNLGVAYRVQFEDNPDDLSQPVYWFNWFKKWNVLHVSKDKEDLRCFLVSDKFGI